MKREGATFAGVRLGGAAVALAAACSAASCGGNGREEDRGRPAVIPDRADQRAQAPSSPAAPPIEAEPFPAGSAEGAFLAAAGALPAWTAVLERAHLLARRGERGAVWGRVGPEIEGSLWLLDESQAAPGLGIRLAGAGQRGLAVQPGRRVVAWGAWGLDGERRWVWRAERLVGLSPPGAAAGAGAGSGPASAPLPGRLLGELPGAPDGALLPSERKKAGPLRFAVLAAPVKAGDGWTIGDTGKGPPTAVLLLPGEGPIHGGLDYLSPDERWPLEPGQWYAAPVIVSSRPPRQDDLPVLRTRRAPAHIPPPAEPPGGKRQTEPRNRGAPRRVVH